MNKHDKVLDSIKSVQAALREADLLLGNLSGALVVERELRARIEELEQVLKHTSERAEEQHERADQLQRRLDAGGDDVRYRGEKG